LRHMRTSRAIDAIMPRTCQAVLATLLMEPERSWYAADLARHLRVRPSSLQREFAELTAAGILKSHRQGRMVFFQADQESPVFHELRGLLAKTAGLVDVLRDALAPLDGHVACAFVYGSVAAGEEGSQSDIDLMIIGDVRLAVVVDALRPGRERLAREINPRLYTPGEFAKRVSRNDHFLKSVLAKPKLFVIGAADELERIAQKEPRRARADEQRGDR
ncbi:MAG: nucleotidyltransferase domain-containing protein, partial [Tepidisphaeraceae bacterium]